MVKIIGPRVLPPGHVTYVKSGGTKKFWGKTEAERKAFMKGGGALAKLNAEKMQSQGQAIAIAQFNADRDATLRALDVKGMEDFYRRWNKPLPDKWVNEHVPMAIMHKVRLAITVFTEEEKAVSRAWLDAHGFDYELFTEEAMEDAIKKAQAKRNEKRRDPYAQPPLHSPTLTGQPTFIHDVPAGSPGNAPASEPAQPAHAPAPAQPASPSHDQGGSGGGGHSDGGGGGGGGGGE